MKPQGTADCADEDRYGMKNLCHLCAICEICGYPRIEPQGTADCADSAIHGGTDSADVFFLFIICVIRVAIYGAICVICGYLWIVSSAVNCGTPLSIAKVIGCF
jgi:hypothetical protein